MKKEKIFLVVVDLQRRAAWPAEDIARELETLVLSCGGEVVGTIICKCPQPTAAYFLNTGKVDEIAQLVLEKEAQTVVVSQDLKGSQQRNLEEIFKVKTIDRTQLILDIFARRAKSLEGKMQVELAQLQYLLPRLTGKGIALSRLGGGIGTMGPGETKLEVDRRHIARRIDKLKTELKAVRANRELTRKKRKDQEIPAVALVGYTNAGKSTLLNALTQADQVTCDGLFTTLDPLSRQYVLPSQKKLVLCDTVGFMYELPHHLIEAFKATLEEVEQSDLLLHIVDVSNPRFKNLYDAVMSILGQLDVREKPMITVFNKIDKLEDISWLEDIRKAFHPAVFLSAREGKNLSALIEALESFLPALTVEIDISLPLDRMDVVHRLHKEGHVLSVEYSAGGIQLRATAPEKIARQILSKIKNSS